MIQSKQTEILVGLFVAAGLAALFVLAMKVSNLGSISDDSGYQVTAHFQNIGGLKPRSPVSMAGVRVGRVASIHLDPETYDAVVTLNIYSQYDNIPLDSSASIYTAGLLGEQYIGLEAGADDFYLADGDEITLTQPAVVLEQIIGQFLYGMAEGE
ncbi:outer membrane lipid asymmetry maintenance protein MlaD [Methylophaga sp. OBS3]|jgi:phospholipid/cholesterol/gamma-HCH transport system substrate-binding protein|uniref:outer membrane lipid asymmetry maintenance protein MlaD n=1 Tax=Methylophaga sp. OBS3 TaxID=2991934 RepID=UPI0022589898|nr:outer membrane lipid asymmetry maintenance protein MlaD [Methylophaga sp. OBS3]MCX4190480.1 outer membrane lipid asymmetry maintenance protein MlaD [Methylophaga sp. OBS3]